MRYSDEIGDPEQKDPKDRREVDPPIEVESATWSAGGQLDWWVKERQQRLRLELTASGPTPDRATLIRLRDRGANRALVWLPQDTAGGISYSDTERFLDDLVATSVTES